MALTADRELNFYTTGELIEHAVDDNVIIYKGAFVGLNIGTGYARPLTAGDRFLGVAYAQVDNTSPGHTAGGKRIKLHQEIDIVHALAGAVNDDVGATVFASSDDTLTFSATGNSRVGKVASIEASNVARVRCQPSGSASGAAELEPLLSTTASLTVTADMLNRTLLAGNTAAITITLPSSANLRAGDRLRLVKTTSDAQTITIDGNGRNINGSATYTAIDAQYEFVELVYSGTEWLIVGS